MKKFETKAIHVGVQKDKSYNSVITPIYPTSTFFFDELGVNKGYDYTRSHNPTRAALEENLAALEGGERAWATATGMAAETTLLFLLKNGDHLIAGHDIYGGTYRLFANIVPRMGIEVSFIDMRHPENVKKAIRPNTKAIWIETPSNPLLNIVDIEAIVTLAKNKKILTIADNTYMSPYFQRPFESGVDIVLHSTTKYINGHSDVVGGVVIVNKDRGDLGDRINYLFNALGTACSPFDAWLVLRGVKTLPQRMEAHQRGALKVAQFLQDHPSVKKVYYSGLPSHPQRELIKKQMKGFGGMLAFEIDSKKVDIRHFFKKLQYFSLAESLGGVESLIEQPWGMSHASMTETARREAGLSPELIRVSVGIENPEDLIEDLKNGLKS
ncbi:MAG: cystathionine gamma-synthase [Deltaproteobacteria bacterium RIFCSPLOWO2_12_FULL_50_11]|nr:MAG: cystathionine gamma-synthase [Deltaproteobacteria bacterium RIFCSPLOWO2_12_FULL_50_11]